MSKSNTVYGIERLIAIDEVDDTSPKYPKNKTIIIRIWFPFRNQGSIFLLSDDFLLQRAFVKYARNFNCILLQVEYEL